MDVNNEEDYVAECPDDIKQSEELIQEESDTKCEQLITGDFADVKYVNTQDYLDIGETVLSKWNIGASEVAASLGFIKEEHIDLDDVQILADTEKMEVRQDSCTIIKTEEEINAGTSSISKNEDVPAYVTTATDKKGESCRSLELEMLKDQVASWRVILHRLPTDTLPPSTSSSGGAVKTNINTSYYCYKETDNKLQKDAVEGLLDQPLKVQMRKHAGEMRYKCELCDHESVNSGHLKRHMRIHTGEKPYECETCDFKSTQSSDLYKHIRTHTGEKPYKCGRCDYKTTNSTALKIHMRTHTGEKPYKCETCDFRTNHSGVLKTHIRTHTGEKPYKCGMCHYKTADSSYLKKHMRTHTGQKPYKCETCDFRTNHSRSLKMHMQTHTREKSY